MDCIRNFELLQSSWEKSKRAEGMLQIYNTNNTSFFDKRIVKNALPPVIPK